MNKIVFFILAALVFVACNSGNKNKAKNQPVPKDSTNLNVVKDTLPKKDTVVQAKTDTDNTAAVDTFFQKIAGEKALIIPGKSIGILKIGDSGVSTKRIGRPDMADAGMCKSINQWFYDKKDSTKKKEIDIFIACNPNQGMQPAFQWLRTNDSRFKTPAGLCVGDSLQEIHNQFKNLKIRATYQSSKGTVNIVTTEKGIAFEMTGAAGKLTQSSVCVAIVVYNPNEGFHFGYFSFYKHLKMM